MEMGPQTWEWAQEHGNKEHGNRHEAKRNKPKNMRMGLAVTVSESTAAIIRHAAASSFAEHTLLINTLGLEHINTRLFFRLML